MLPPGEPKAWDAGLFSQWIKRRISTRMLETESDQTMDKLHQERKIIKKIDNKIHNIDSDDSPLEESFIDARLMTKKVLNLHEDDFQILKILSEGNMARTVMALRNDNDRLYALKMINKADLLKYNQVPQALQEKKILMKVDHPFLIHTEFC
jgi:hypothetical protein